jgi:predicted NodU family carbamoyl transferase
MGKPIYVLGTGLSHDGSACLLKDGRVAVAIEKERLTRLKHDGGNDTAAIRYCLEAEGIAIDDLSVIVQNSNFGDFGRGNAWFDGPRIIPEDCPVPVVTISHHLAHAYSALGMCPFEDCNILVVDGCGNGADECKGIDEAAGRAVGDDDTRHLFFEKDSYYSYRGGRLETIFKDFSPWGLSSKGYPLTPNTTKHSIGGVYAAVSSYCLRGREDLGKLMGLAPYGRPGAVAGEIFDLRNGRVFVRYDWMRRFDRPARSDEQFRTDFQYYADIARWVQREVERALLYLIEDRLRISPCDHLAYAGGVALNAVANSLIRRSFSVKDLFIVPAAGDNGIALGCAFYGWLEVLERSRVVHDGSTCFGRAYPLSAVRESLDAAMAGAARATASPEMPVNVFLFLIRLVHQCFKTARAGGWTGSLCWKAGGSAPVSTLVDWTSCQLLEGEVVNPNVVVSGPAQTIMAFFLGNLHPARALESGRLECTNPDGFLTFYRAIDWEEVAAGIRRSSAVLGRLPEREFQILETGDSVTAAARLLADGKIVAWFQDGSEFGPRALGRRSLLADPGLSDVRDVINREIKRREDFRPFAPSVLREDAASFFDCDFESPYMILVAQVRPAWSERLRSVVHEDGSARLQTVTGDWNPKYHRLLTEFRELSGISVLLNTSFNRRGMPIVETPDQALSFFRETPRLDALVLDRFVVTRT